MAQDALNRIAQLYAIEAEAREVSADQRNWFVGLDGLLDSNQGVFQISHAGGNGNSDMTGATKC